MEKEKIIKALYDSTTEESVQRAHDEWLNCYQQASESDQAYLMVEYHKYGAYMLEESRRSSLEVQAVLAEIEAMKLAESQG